MFIASPWTVALGALTLLNQGDMMKDDEGSGIWDVVNDTAMPLRSSYAVNLRAFNASTRFGFTRCQVLGTPAEARAARMNFLANLPLGAPADCLITDGTEGVSYTLPQALIQQGLKHWVSNDRFYYTVELKGGQIQINPVPGVPQIDGGPFTGEPFSLAAGWPIDGGNFADNQQEPAYALDGGSF